jgi:hypothetical protein
MCDFLSFIWPRCSRTSTKLNDVYGMLCLLYGSTDKHDWTMNWTILNIKISYQFKTSTFLPTSKMPLMTGSYHIHHLIWCLFECNGAKWRRETVFSIYSVVIGGFQSSSKISWLQSLFTLLIFIGLGQT